jgi:hypothetical protein
MAPATALVVATSLSVAGLASSSLAATDSPAIHLVVPTAQQEVQRYSKEPVALYDLGIYAVAEKAKFEIRTQRGASYRDPIKATMTVGEGADAKVVDLPSSLITDVNKLKKFFAFSVTNKAGKVVKSGKVDFCPDSYAAERANRDGAATSPYPQQCGAHPFAMGNVLGIQRGWSVPTFGDWENPLTFKGKDGTYTLRVLILAPWRKALGLTKADADASVKLKVKTVKEDAEGSLRGGEIVPQHDMAAMSGMAGMHETAAAGGSLSPQHAKMEAVRKKALGKAAVPHAARPTNTLKAAAVGDGPQPDLRSVPAYQIELSRLNSKGNRSKNTYLNFGATVWNAGPSPLVVDGFRIKNTKLMDAFQYFYDAADNEVGSTPAGQL